MQGPALLLALLVASPVLAGCLAGAPDESLQRGDRNAGGGPAREIAWASLEEAVVRPGVAIHTPTGTCPSNFLFVRPDHTSVFLGTTAWCMRDVPVGGVVTIGGAEVLGFLAYSSFETMRENGETDPQALEYNDFAVVKVDTSYHHLVNPTMLHYGGPAGMADAANASFGGRVRTYTNGTDGATRAQEGVVTGRAGDWALLVHEAPPTLPGAMGRGALTEDGMALGVVVSLGVAPNPGASGIARLDALMAYAHEHARLYMQLVPAPLLDAPVLVPSLPVEAPPAAVPRVDVPAAHPES